MTLLNGDLEYQKALHTFAVLGFPGCEVKPLKTLSNSKGWAGDGLSKCCWDQVETNPAPAATQWWPMSVAGLHTLKYFRTVNCKSCFKQEEFHWAFLMFKNHVCQDIWQPYICCYIWWSVLEATQKYGSFPAVRNLLDILPDVQV